MESGEDRAAWRCTTGAHRTRRPPGYPAGVSTDTSGPLDSRPPQVTVAAALLAVEGALIAGWGLVSLVLLALGRTEARGQFAMLVVTVLLLAVLPFAAARGLWLLRRWSRGPSVVVQLMALPVAWQLLGADGWWTLGGVVLGLIALAALVALFTPTTTEALGILSREA